MSELDGHDVMIGVVELSDGRTISWAGNRAERLVDRLPDVRAAVSAAVASVGVELAAVPVSPGWQLDEVSAAFAVTLTAEAGVILGKTGGQASFEVTVSLRRQPSPAASS